MKKQFYNSSWKNCDKTNTL